MLLPLFPLPLTLLRLTLFLAVPAAGVPGPIPCLIAMFLTCTGVSCTYTPVWVSGRGGVLREVREVEGWEEPPFGGVASSSSSSEMEARRVIRGTCMASDEANKWESTM